jgi:hypothetical protein
VEGRVAGFQRFGCNDTHIVFAPCLKQVAFHCETGEKSKQVMSFFRGKHGSVYVLVVFCLRIEDLFALSSYPNKKGKREKKERSI